jgi:hypothetical protein
MLTGYLDLFIQTEVDFHIQETEKICLLVDLSTELLIYLLEPLEDHAELLDV